MPKLWIYIGALLVPVAVMPFAIVAVVQSHLSPEPRIAIIQDMGRQPKLKTQILDPAFADHRAMRPPVPGTVARGQLEDDDFFYRGFPRNFPQRSPDATTQTAPPAEPAWFKGYPAQVKVDMTLLERGRERYNIYCAVCHGEAGYGDGMVHRRALALKTPGWVNPANLHEDKVVKQENGRLFNTITNGNPGGRMPPYGAQIPPGDRWAIIAYLRALQRSQAANPADVPPNILNSVQSLPSTPTAGGAATQER